MKHGAVWLSLVSMVVLWLLAVSPVWALECKKETLFYDNWKDEKIHEKANLYADKAHLAWGTEVCPISIKKRWLTTWVQVRLEDGGTGWLDDDDLATISDFHDSARGRHTARISDLNALLAEMDSMEVVMQNLQIDIPEQDLLSVLRPWVKPTLLPSDAGPAEALVTDPEPTATPKLAAPVTNTTSNLRRGPGTDFPLADQLPAGAPVRPVARNSDGTWLQLDSGLWIWAQLVDHIPPGLPVTALPPTPIPPTNTPVPQVPAVPPSTGDPHRNMLVQLPVGNRSHHDTYDRDEWNHWVDDDRDCENARAEVLIAESRQSVTYRSNGCTVDTGLWVGPWGGQTFTQASQVDIDHHVPLHNAHISGGHAWSRNQKQAYANDLSLASALQTTESGVNRAKGAGAPDEWRPPVQASWCRYAQDWIEVKHKYGLLVTQAEKSALLSMLDNCTGQSYVPAAQPAPPAQATPVPPADAPQSNFPPPRRRGQYCNDFDTRAQYEAFYADRAKPASHDRDGDGRYCEALN